jgi:hypothetical protein
MRHSPRTSRRHFLASTAASAAALGLSSHLRADDVKKPIRIAFIGCGGRGGSNLQSVTGQSLVPVEVTALCDVNAQAVAAAGNAHPNAARFSDFRKLYEHADLFDAVVVSTTEHTHAYATMPALQLGKGVYCEKPLTRDVEECRRITEAAAKAGVPTQMGTQIHAGGNYRRVVEAIWSDAIGPVTECHVWVSRAWGLQSPEAAQRNGDIVSVTDRPAEAQTPPEHLNWDLWLGPAPERPYNNVYFPGPKWYRWWDFGNGTMSDLGSHWNDLPFWALRLTAPTSIEASGDAPHPEIAPASMTARYDYPARAGWGPLDGSLSMNASVDPTEMPPCSVTWYQGEHKPQIWKDGGIPQWGDGVLFIGEKGMLLSDYGRHVLLPEAQYAGHNRSSEFLGHSPGQHEEWLLALAHGTPTASPFSYAGPLTEANHLGNVAFRAGKKINWDATNLTTGDPHADQFLKRQPRSGWSLD